MNIEAKGLEVLRRKSTRFILFGKFRRNFVVGTSLSASALLNLLSEIGGKHMVIESVAQNLAR